MHSDINDVLAFEIKKEIADRYFGFRKMIEEDKMALSERIRQHSLILEKRICFELVRIYILLADEELINEFTSLIGWDETLYYDPYLAESPTIRERVFKGIEKKGLTKAGRYKNLFFDSYERLEIHVDQYREKLQELVDSHETISEEIKLFYQKNDIGNIMCFLRSLNSSACAGQMLGGIDAGLQDDHEKKMRVEPPLPIEQQLPTIQPIVPLGTIRKKLRKLVDRAYKLRGGTSGYIGRMNLQPTYASIQLAAAALVGGLIMLSAGGEFLVKGATKIATRWGMPPLLIGLTIVAFGTSMPELFVGLIALFQNHTDIMVGNVVGSNIANIGLILGICALIVPLHITYSIIKLELYLVLLASLALMAIAQFGTVLRPFGLIFVGSLIGYTYLGYRNAVRKKKNLATNETSQTDIDQRGTNSYPFITFLMISGFLLLAYGSDFFISGAVDIAKFLGIDDLIIGLTLAAIGTSLPELASCFAALRHRQSDLLVGNIIGSNLFNILMVLGIGAIAKPFTLSSGLLIRDLPVMFAFSAVLVPIFFFGHKLNRWHGALMLLSYAGYIWLLT